MSADGKTALPSREQLRISCEEDIKRMYMLRNSCDAVLVGVETILSDDPKLTVKDTYVKHPRQPLRVVLDSKGRTPQSALVVNQAASTLIFTVKGNERQYPRSHVEVIGCDADSQGHVNLHEALQVLSQKGIHTVLVEGGGTVIWNFLYNDLVDDLYVYIGPLIIGGAQTPTLATGPGITTEKDLINLTLVDVKKLGPGLLVHYQRKL